MGHKIEQISLALTNHCFGILVELTIVSNSKGKFCSKHLENVQVIPPKYARDYNGRSN